MIFDYYYYYSICFRLSLELICSEICSTYICIPVTMLQVAAAQGIWTSRNEVSPNYKLITWHTFHPCWQGIYQTCQQAFVWCWFYWQRSQWRGNGYVCIVSVIVTNDYIIDLHEWFGKPFFIYSLWRWHIVCISAGQFFVFTFWGQVSMTFYQYNNLETVD